MAFMRASQRTAAKRAIKRLAYARLCAEVDARDEGLCRVCCAWVGQRGHHHHIVFRSRGGGDSVDNLITVCPECHAAIHARRVGLCGTARQLTITYHKTEAL